MWVSSLLFHWGTKSGMGNPGPAAGEWVKITGLVPGVAWVRRQDQFSGSGNRKWVLPAGVAVW